MTWPGAMRSAWLATLGRRRWWLVALAGFLVRGGLLVLLPAIIVIPTPAELAANLTPSITGAAPGDLTPALVELVARVVVATTAVLVLTTLAGASLEAGLVGEAAGAAELGSIARPVDAPLARAAVARLLTHLPTLVAIVVGGLALAEAAYAELVSPSTTGPLAGRVVARAPGAVAAIGLAWLVGEAWGGMTLRRLGAGDSLLAALGHGLAGVLRPSGLATLGLTTLVVAGPLVVLWLAAGRAFERLWPLVVDRADPEPIAIALGLFAGIWVGGLGILAVALAFRSVAWTAEALRAD